MEVKYLLDGDGLDLHSPGIRLWVLPFDILRINKQA
jgi:hypothetical protein